jgi:hypothetical protein
MALLVLFRLGVAHVAPNTGFVSFLAFWAGGAGAAGEPIPELLFGGKRVPLKPHHKSNVNKRSSNVKTIIYDPNCGEMKIKFKTNAEYSYTNVPFSTYDCLNHAESVGSHFHEHVKGKYFYTKALK